MPTNTPELQLYKKDPATDGGTNFDVKTMMNDNWDKIDADAVTNKQHRTSTTNPHNTTAAQVGAYSKTETDNKFLEKTHAGSGGAAHALAVPNGAAGFFSGPDKGKLDGIPSNANYYVHPSGDGNLHVPATGTSNNSKVLKSGATAGSVAWGFVAFTEITNKPTTLGGYGITDAAPSSHVGSGGAAHALAVANGANGFFSGTDKGKLDGIEEEANNYSHPTGDGNLHVPMTGTGNNGKVLKAGATAGSAAWGFVAFTEITSKPTTLSGYGITDAAPSSHVGSGGTAHAAVVANGANGFMLGTDKKKLDDIEASANKYVHPTGDGNLHVPATLTSNDGKFLKAGATAGSLSWQFINFTDLASRPTTLSGYGITDAAPSSHVTNTANPHNTTAAQVGAFSTTESDARFAQKAGFNKISVQTLAPSSPSSGDIWIEV